MRGRISWKWLLALALLWAGVACWLLRPVPGASSWTGRTLCGPVGAGSTGDGVEEAYPSGPIGEAISLHFTRVTFYGRFSGILEEGRFGGGVPVSGWLRARGLTASYRANSGARGRIRGTCSGKTILGRCTERYTESLAGERQGLTTSFNFRLEPCDK